ncbi:MAG: glycosyltransferase [Flavobacteriales bacterium]
MALRVLLLAAGNSVHTMRWAEAFAKRGCAVHLVTQHAPVVQPGAGISVHPLPYKGATGYMLNGPAVRRITAAVRPHVVNAHYATGYGTLARWCSGTPLVLNVWGSDVFDFPEKSAFHKMLMRSNLLRADSVVSTSEVMAKRTRTLCLGLQHLHVVPFGVESAVFKPRDASAAPDGSVVIGTVKTLAPKYGVDTLVDAYALLRKRMGDQPKTTLRIVGTGPQMEALRSQAATLGIAQHVQFVGAVPHNAVPDELRRMAIFCALSRDDSESFGVAVVEASSCALPVVVSDAGGLPEVVSNGVTGWVVPRENAEAAVTKLHELVVDAAQRQRMGAMGRAVVLERYEWDTCVDRQLEVLNLACQRR